MTCTDAVRDAPPSRALIMAHVCRQPATVKDLGLRTGLARRTLYGALKELQTRGLVRRVPSLRDTRQHFYRCRDAHQGACALTPQSGTR